MVRPNAELFNEYEKYGLTNNTLTGWATRDGSNTPATRCVRTFIAHQVHGNVALRHASLASAHMFEGIDLNDSAVANDLFAVLTEIYRQADAEAAFAQVLNVPIPELAATETWRRWILIDKNDPAVRHDLQETILHALRSLRAKDVPDARRGGRSACQCPGRRNAAGCHRPALAQENHAGPSRQDLPPVGQGVIDKCHRCRPAACRAT